MPDPATDPVDGTPAAPTVPPGDRFGAALEIVLCSGFPTQILLGGVLFALGMRVRTPAGQLSPAFVFTVSLLDTLLLGSLIVFFIRAHRESAREIFFGGRPVVREALIGVILLPLLFFIVFVVRAIVLTFAPWLHNVTRNPFEDLMQTGRDAFAFGVVATVAGGVREELQRAFILRRFEVYLGGGAVGIVVWSVTFGYGHLEQGIDAALATALLGATWGAVYLARGSIVAPMVSHGAFNVAQLLMYLMYSAVAVR